MPPDDSVKPVDDSTREKIDALSDKFDVVHKRIDESSMRLEAEIDKKFLETKQDRIADKQEVAATLKENTTRGRWVIGVIVSIATVGVVVATSLIGWYLTSVREELRKVTAGIDKTNIQIAAVVEKSNQRDVEIGKIGIRLDTHQKLESKIDVITNRFESETDKLEERIRELERNKVQ